MKRKTEQLQGQKSIRSFFFAPRTERERAKENVYTIGAENEVPDRNTVETTTNLNRGVPDSSNNDVDIAEAPSLHPSPANDERSLSPTTTKKPSPSPPQQQQQLYPSQSPPTDGINAYEKQRLERIRRNTQVMAQLGLLQSAAALAAQCSGGGERTKKPPKKNNNRKNPKSSHVGGSGPVRRSSRHLGTTNNDNNNDNDQLEHHQHRETTPQLVFQNSNVHTYVCQLFHQSAPCTSSNNDFENDDDEWVISSFAKLGPATMYDPALTKAYASNWQPGLVAAGGKDGICAIFGSSAIENGKRIEHHNDNDDGLVPSLMSSKLHKGWISDVQWVPGPSTTTTTAPMSRLLTAGNDGIVSLWDLSQTAAVVSLNSTTTMKTIPQNIAQSSTIHGGHGIFSLHHNGTGGRIVTGSKDYTVAISSLYQGSSDIKVVQRYEDLHDGVVKCVRWRSSSNAQLEEECCFASCGNDRKIAIVDTRQSTTTTTASIDIVDSHSTAINCLRWHPSNPNLLLTASHDPHILIHDIRNTALPLFTLTGHILPSIKRVPHIYQPTWVAEGDAVATPAANNTALVVYCAKTGEAISQGEMDLVGGQIGLIGCRGLQKGDPLVCVTTRHVHLLKPKFEKKEGILIKNG